jgi:CelD/BcsL family acetyltransferase involved in cellulose biosynthesis
LIYEKPTGMGWISLLGAASEGFRATMIDKGPDKNFFIPFSVLAENAEQIRIVKNNIRNGCEEVSHQGRMNIRVLTTVKELESIKSEWDELLKNSGNDIINLTHDWIMAWWNNFGSPYTLYTILAYNASQKIVGIAPCMKVKSSYRGIPVNKITLMANGYSPSADIIAKKDQTEHVIKAIIRHLEDVPGWDILELTKIQKDGSTSAVILSYLEKKKKCYGIKDNIESPYVVINSDWTTFLSSKSQKFRKTLRNKLNRADNAGDLSIDKIMIKESSQADVVDMISVSQKSWKRQIQTDIMSTPCSVGFYKEICDRFGPQGLVSLFLLKKGDDPIAFEFHLTYNNTAYPIRADFDESFKHLSPGSVLESHILKTLFDESQIKEYNTCGHTYDYLVKWTDNTRKYINAEIFNENLRARSLYVLEYKVIPLLRRMKLNVVKHYITSKRRKYGFSQ